MIKYEWNNILHQEIFELINTIVESKNIDYKKSVINISCNILKNYFYFFCFELFEKFDILTFIIKFMVVEDYVMPKFFFLCVRKYYLYKF